MKNLAYLSKTGILVSYGTEFRVVDLEEAVVRPFFVKNQNGVESSILHSSMKVSRNKEEVPLGDLQGQCR